MDAGQLPTRLVPACIGALVPVVVGEWIDSEIQFRVSRNIWVAILYTLADGDIALNARLLAEFTQLAVNLFSAENYTCVQLAVASKP